MLTNDVTNQQGVKMPRLQWNVVKRWLTFIRNAIMRRCEIHEHEAINRLRFFYQSCSHPSDTIIIVTLEVMICFFGCEFVTNVLHHHHYFSFSLHGCCCKHSPLWFHGKFHKKGGTSSPPPPPNSGSPFGSGPPGPRLGPCLLDLALAGAFFKNTVVRSITFRLLVSRLVNFSQIKTDSGLLEQVWSV